MADEKKAPDEISETEAAKLLGLRPRTLQSYRYLGTGPPYRRYRHGKPRICYNPAEVTKWRRNGNRKS